MNTLADAWEWYQAVRDSLARFQRLGVKHWDELPWGDAFRRDDWFRELDADTVTDAASLGLRELDDFAVFVLFSVFEAQVRDRVLADTSKEREAVKHPSLQFWMGQAKESIEEGSFFRVLASFKSGGSADLVELINQVRRYRNWVAHGRRGVKPEAVSPKDAFERLSRFLDLLRATGTESE
jgi:hypothetical protein